MARLVVTRALLAPVAIVIATTAVPPKTSIVSPVSEWLDRNVPPTLTAVYSTSEWIKNELLRNPAGDVTADKPEDRRAVASLGSPNAVEIPRTATISPPVQDSASISQAPVPLPRPAPRTAITLATKPTPETPSAPIVMAPAEKPVLASLSVTDPVDGEGDTNAAASLSAEDTKIADTSAPAKTPADEKQVYASLGSQPAVMDAPAAAEPLPSEDVDIASDGEPAENPTEDKEAHTSLGSPTTTDTTLSADIAYPAAKQFPSEADATLMGRRASLGSPTRGDAAGARSEPAFVPPEKIRVAYDAPVTAERPESIGKRRYVDNFNYTGLGSPEALLEALRHMGANAKTLGLPASLWCADFMNMVLRKSGLDATGSRAARSYLKYGKRISEPRVGAIAIFTRGKNGGHIGIVRGTDGAGNPIIVSGNYNNRVAEAVYPKSRVLAYVVPPELPPQQANEAPARR